MHVMGIDEVGRGAWAGPMVIGGVVLSEEMIKLWQFTAIKASIKAWRLGDMLIRDSKLLTEAQRELAYSWIVAHSRWQVEEISVSQIDKGMSSAWKGGVERIIKRELPKKALVDGNWSVTVPGVEVEAIVKGDQSEFQIACASIVAKVWRDRLMATLGKEFPAYGWDKNKGYGTKVHQAGILTHGMCQWHRRSWVEGWLQRQGQLRLEI